MQIFAICAFGTTTSFDGFVDFLCQGKAVGKKQYSYPFRLAESYNFTNCSDESAEVKLYGDFSSDAQFFVCTGVLSMLYCIAIIVIYAKFDDKYKSNAQWPLIVSIKLLNVNTNF